MFNSPYILSPPIPVYWLGWRSDTHQLQQAGWQISGRQEAEKRTYRIAIKHPEVGLYGLSNEIDYTMWKMTNSFPADRLPPFNINIMAKSINIVRYGEIQPNVSFLPVDTTPEFSSIASHEIPIQEFALFKPVNIDAKQVFLREASLSEILDIALSKQDDKQSEIRTRMIRDKKLKEYRQASEVRAELRLVA